jgi:hypothetical protein
MPYREDEDALRARVDSLEDEASAEHAENERLRAELAEAKAHEKPARDASPSRSKKRRLSALKIVAIILAAIGGCVGIVAFATRNDGVHGTIFSEGGKLGTWQAEITKCESRGHQFDGLDFLDGNGANRAQVIVDAKGDTYLWGYQVDPKPWGYRAERHDSTTLDAKLTRTIYGHTRDGFDGSLAFDCKLADGRVHGTLTFQRCF